MVYDVLYVGDLRLTIVCCLLLLTWQEVDPQQDRLMWSVPPAFVLELVEIDGV